MPSLLDGSGDKSYRITLCIKRTISIKEANVSLPMIGSVVYTIVYFCVIIHKVTSR